MGKPGFRVLAGIFLSISLAFADGEPVVRLVVEPASIELQGRGADHGLLVSADDDGGRRTSHVR